MTDRINAMFVSSFFVSFFVFVIWRRVSTPIRFLLLSSSKPRGHFNRSKLVYSINSDVKNRVKIRLHSLASNNL